MGRFVGDEEPDGRRMPIRRWSMMVADRRIPHFFATRLMQAPTLVGWACDLVLPAAASVLLVVLFGGLHALGTLLLFRAINRGVVISWHWCQGSSERNEHG